MSESNIELANQIVDAINRRDLPRLIELTDPEVEWRSFFAALGEGGVYDGHDGIRAFRETEEALKAVGLPP